MPFARTVTAASALGSALLSAVLWGAFFVSHSRLAQAQAADSLLDVLTALVLAWAVHIASQPGDARHPFGHRSAEPLGAMLVAAMAAVLAYRVGTDAWEALWARAPATPHASLAGVFVAKAAFRAAIAAWIARRPRMQRSPATHALFVDARNDVLLAVGSLLGVVGARRGVPLLDPALALPIALWIGWSGVELARDNTRLLMGEAPPEARQRELLDRARTVAGILGVVNLRAHYVGQYLVVHLHVQVDRALTVGEAHDLGEQVRAVLVQEPDVDRCEVHLEAQVGDCGHSP